MNPKLIINVTDARRLLGATGADLSDDEVQRVVSELDELASAAIASYVVQKTQTPVDAKGTRFQNGSK